MLKTTIHDKKPQNSLHMRDLQVGQIGSLEYGGEILYVTKIYGGIVVALNDPNKTWTLCIGEKGDLLTPVNSITIDFEWSDQ